MTVTYVDQVKDHFQKNNRFRDYQSHSCKVHSVDWSCDGHRLASGSVDKSISIFNLDKDRLNKESTLKGHSDSVDQLSWHPSHPDILATASLDKTVRLWDARTSKNYSTINTKGENINICWSPDGSSIAVGNKEDLITFIDAKQQKIKVEQSFKFEVNEISWNNDNDLFFLTSGQGCIHVLSYPDLQPQIVLNAHPANCICIEFDSTGKYFAVGSADTMVSLWDANHLVCLRTISRLEWPARAISFSHDGKLLASGSEDLLIDISYVETGEKITGVPVDSPTFTVAFHPSRYILAFACDDKDTFGRDCGTVKIFGLPNN
ncbi:THO complex subunit 3-like [Panonychus citri]|uniref:THO complex subunit 3-like n=1 Tax=Panonychus citri TaxID=50023 RepID=UPI0023078A55|nr:THO complex subunit 3-like [Panonychus citri]